MSLTKYESTVKIIPHDCDVVYSRLADLNNLSKVQAYFKEPANRETFAAQIPADKIKQIEVIQLVIIIEHIQNIMYVQHIQIIMKY